MTASAQHPDRARWPLGLDGIGYGGDYNPEQWPDEVREEDVRLMQEAGVTIVSVAIFSWARIEPREGELDWTWLDRTMDRLHGAGIRVSLATATASPPPWLTTKHPEILPVRDDGTVLWPGSRQHYRIASPVWRRYALAMARRVAERYADHPALSVWHVDNEIGCHVPHDFSDDAATAFRAWLRARYGTVDALNHAWGTAFWSQQYGSFDEVLPPRTAATLVNPTHRLDFARYSSDELLSYYTDLRDVLREVTPHVPATTNFMVQRHTGNMDYARWADEVDVVSNDHYVYADDPAPHVELAFSADLTRSVARGEPWMLMEHSTSAVNWQGRNRARTSDESLRHSVQHLAHGADAIMFFQWRQSAAGAEKYHSAMLPHAGTDTDVWRNTVRLGNLLKAVGEVRGATQRPRAAVLFDWPSTWAAQLDSHPTDALDPRQQAVALHRALARRAVEADVVRATEDLTGYDVVLVPALYLVTDEGAAAVAAVAERGASVLVTFFSGIVDEHDHVRLGGYPGAFRDLLGVRTEEFWPLQPDERVRLDDGTEGELWSEKVHALDGTEVVRRFAGGPLDGVPAVTRRAVGAGAAWYLATWPTDADALQRVVDALVEESGVPRVVPDLPEGVEVTRRVADDGRSWLFVLNHTGAPVTVVASGQALVDPRDVDGTLEVAAGAVEVVREAS
ncbi:beta-galactosidase [Cellulomonas telluris]|uniref:beta-galactosidase n=1 Tax=Cellulomonas telluris TaxID=2306636 RepID=UPI0010A79790|nr:beta-galactosidase [Cellulomonas telluris]